MINRVGISSINHKSKTRNNSKKKSKGNTFITGRVKDIILNENHPEFENYGNLNSIGIIFLEVVDFSNNGTEKIARPLYPNIKSYPIIGELVMCFLAATPTLNSKNYKNEFYYINSLNLWNNPHHNVSPNPRVNLQSPLENLSYQQTEAGLTKSPSESPIEINYNSPLNPSQNTFIERSNIHPLMPFMGDVLYEGRFGQSIRFGSTTKTDSQYSNNWSNNGNDGDPIIIIKNGQPINTSEEGWIPITEDINNDLSSFYQTSTQKIPIEVANNDYFSYQTPPIEPNQYSSPQNILNSNRIIINAKTDHVLISGEKSVGLSSNNSVNIDAKSVYIDSSDVKLGGNKATEPILLGDKTVNLLDQLLDTLTNILTVLESDQIYPGGTPVPNAPLNLVALNAKQQVISIKSQLNSTKSKISKTL